MMFIKFVMSRGSDKTVDYDQAMRILASEQQLIMLKDLDGNITPESLNKAHIVGTERDYDREKSYRADQAAKSIKLAMPDITPAQLKKNKKKMDEMRATLSKKLGWSKS